MTHDTFLVDLYFERRRWRRRRSIERWCGVWSNFVIHCGRRRNRVMLRLKRCAAASRAALLLSAIALVVFGEGLWR